MTACRPPSTGAVCGDCGAELSPDEVHYYGNSCERCERRAMRRISDDIDATPSAEVVSLYQDERPHTTRLGADLRQVMEDHIRRGHVTEADVMGCITLLMFDTWRLLRELEDGA